MDWQVSGKKLAVTETSQIGDHYKGEFDFFIHYPEVLVKIELYLM